MGRNRKTFPDKFKKEFINCGFSKETKQMKKELEETKKRRVYRGELFQHSETMDKVLREGCPGYLGDIFVFI